MSAPSLNLLVCFALREEASPFRRLAAGRSEAQRILLTGIGPANAERAVRAVLARESPDVVFTCGYAGGLNPEFGSGTVLFSADAEFPLIGELTAGGARPARFHGSSRILVTAAEKEALRQTTGADAVDMESEVIRKLCQERAIPSATVRVISDPADEDLPLDFNQCLTSGQALTYAKVAWAVLRAPQKVAALARLQRQCRQAAQNLARVLAGVIAGGLQSAHRQGD